MSLFEGSITHDLIGNHGLKNKSTIKNLAEELKRHRWQIGTWEKCSISLVIRELQIKTIVQWDTTSHQSEWPSWKSLQTINSGKSMEKRERSYTVGENVN